MTPWFTALPFVHLINFTDREVFHAARFEKGTRYYTIRLEKDLFDDWTINVINGRINTKLGQSRILAYFSYEEAYNAFCGMAYTRHQRGYHFATLSTDNPLLIFLFPFSTKTDKLALEKPVQPKRTASPKLATNHQPSKLPITPIDSHSQLGFIF